jgi:hypothetical protein
MMSQPQRPTGTSPSQHDTPLRSGAWPLRLTRARGGCQAVGHPKGAFAALAGAAAFLPRFLLAVSAGAFFFARAALGRASGVVFGFAARVGGSRPSRRRGRHRVIRW